MTQLTTQARPFARAAFEIAKSNVEIDTWLSALNQLALIMADEAALAYVKNPTLSAEQCAALPLDVLDGRLNIAQQNFVKLLAEKRQLVLLPEIAKLFLEFHARDLQTVNVTVRSAMPIEPELQAVLMAALAKRLQKKISMEIEIDTSLIGGAVISTDDWVMDGSVKEQLKQLEAKVVG